MPKQMRKILKRWGKQGCDLCGSTVGSSNGRGKHYPRPEKIVCERCGREGCPDCVTLVGGMKRCEDCADMRIGDS
jgi:hypothetical protein